VDAALTPEFAEAENGAIERDLLGLVAELVATRRQRRRLSPPPKWRTIGDKRGDRDEALKRWCETVRCRKRRAP
jgi:hypothetical protein